MTLIELLITIAIFTFVVVVIFSVYLSAQKFYQYGEENAEILQNGRIAMERMTREIRQADEIISQIPQTPDIPESPPLTELEFEDGHIDDDYYYIRYYLSTTTNELIRQYRVYCFDSCIVCEDYFRWNDSYIQGEETIYTHPCNIEERLISEYITDLRFWGTNIINIFLNLEKNQKNIQMETKIFGRNL